MIPHTCALQVEDNVEFFPTRKPVLRKTMQWFLFLRTIYWEGVQMKKYFFGLILASLTICFSSTIASAQNTSGVTGVVRDSNGAVVAGADVKLTDTKTGTEQTTQNKRARGLFIQ